LFGWLLLHGVRSLGYHWQWYRVGDFLFSVQEQGLSAGPLLKGLWLTLALSGAALPLAFGFGLAAALLRLSGSVLGSGLARCYLELVRNTPLLVQLFFLYFALGPVLGLDRFTAAALALGVFEGAYASELIRAALLSIGRGQWEAAYSLGLTRWQSYRAVILPQALRRALPPLVSLAVSLVKDSSLATAVAVAELTWRGQVLVSETFLAFEVWFTVAGLYLLVALLLAGLGRALERRFRGEAGGAPA
jgi:polar amino acid transport system permease protein